jgi:hypothetical protein
MALMRVYANNKELDFSKQPTTAMSLGSDKHWLYHLPMNNKTWTPYRLKSSRVRVLTKEQIAQLNGGDALMI